jgi:F-type H+-transporting ATPase subunit delta
MSKQTAVSGLSRRYARALFNVYQGDLKKCRAGLGQLGVLAALFEVELAASVLLSPVMPQDLKVNLINYALNLNPKTDDEIVQFVRVVAEAGRVADLPSILVAFTEMLNSKEGRIVLDVTSVVKLEQSQIDRLKAALGSKGEVDLNNTVDPEVLGGLIVRVGNHLLDLSLKSQLNLMTSHTSSL